MTLIGVIDDLIASDCISLSAICLPHARALRVTCSSSIWEPSKATEQGEGEEEMVHDGRLEELSRIEENKRGLDEAIVNTPIIEILNQVLGLVQSQGRVMGEAKMYVGVLDGKIDEVSQLGKKYEHMFASIQADVKSQ